MHDDLAALGIEIPQPMLERLSEYLDRLLEVNRRMNLTAVREPEAAWRRLMIDSLSVLPWLEHLPDHAKVIDIGTGGGLPGMPLAITRPDLQLTLLDATAKKVRFLTDTSEALGLDNLTCVQQRAEDFGRQRENRGRYDLAIARAVGVMSVVLEYALPVIKNHASVLAMKGPKAEDELRAAGDALDLLGGGEVEVYDAYPARFDNDLVIVRITKAHSTPADYPRLPGVPRKSPL